MADQKHVFISYRRDGAINQQWAETIDARLREYGFTVWRDVDGIQPGQRWTEKIPPTLQKSALVLCIISESLLESEWVDDELNFARNLKLLVVPIRVETEYSPPFILSAVKHFDLHTDEPRAWNELFEFVDRHAPRNKNDTLNPITSLAAQKRQRELEYLDRLLYSGLQVAQLAPIYTELASNVEQRAKNLASALPADLIPASFLHQSRAGRNSGDVQCYDDLLEVFAVCDEENRAPRLALLGEPGAGKSFSLRRLAAQRALAAQEDPAASIPLLVQLGDWIEEELDLPFDSFLRNSLQPLDTDFDELVTSGRAYLLLDALNEIPTSQQQGKIKQIKEWVNDQRLAGLVISCREQDFTNNLQLDIDTVTIEPLDPTRIYQFIQRYLQVIDPANAEFRTEDLFWRLVSGHADSYKFISFAKKIWIQLRDDGVDDFCKFWQQSQDIPIAEEDRVGLNFVINEFENDRSSLLKLAETPYLLNILVGLFLEGNFPEQGKSRAEVFSRFVEDLLLRERKRYQRLEDKKTPPGEAGLLNALSELAWKLQSFSYENYGQSVQTRLPESFALMTLSEPQLDHAVAANLLQSTSQHVNFVHQLLQEYFAAQELKRQIENKQLQAKKLFPGWWYRSGWEETVITTASFFTDDLTPFVDCLADVNPELLASSLKFNGLESIENTLLQQKISDWQQRVSDPVREPDPGFRAAIGAALGKLNCDVRPGVGLDKNGLPDIDWVEIPGGKFLLGEVNQVCSIDTFLIARYPVTTAQYQAFIDDGGYQNERWWQGFPERQPEFGNPIYIETNVPATVTRDDAVAYCCWLSDKLGYTIQLPNEQQWERTARGNTGRAYPWGNQFWASVVNMGEKDSRENHRSEFVSAVGIYPHGASQEGVHDLLGNVWEWCLDIDSTERPHWQYVARGGCDTDTYTGINPKSLLVKSRCAQPRGNHNGFRLVQVL